MKTFKIGNTQIGANSKVYFIADIAANHDGSLLRAKKLILKWLKRSLRYKICWVKYNGN